MKKVHLLYAITLLAAFLLFQIELIIAKIFLPKFGGSYLVWGACMVFFQFALLAGYAYAHVVIKAFGMARYRLWHLAVLLLPLLTFPGRSLPEITAHGNLPLVVDIFLQLAMTIGLAFFALSTVSIVTQSWLAHSRLPEQRNPYPLYAVSNIGSFLGLLSYPFFFEYYYGLRDQLLLWRISYFLFVILYLLALAKISIADKSVAGFRRIFDPSRFTGGHRLTDPVVRLRIYWFLLSAAGCILFLAVTNVMTYEIAPSPLLWIIPLCIYLLSFVLTFRERPLSPRWLTDLFSLVLGLSVLIFFLTQTRLIPVIIILSALVLSLFVLCMFCQHELYQSRPTEKGELTSFYLWVSFGGLAGSFFVTWLAPLLFLTPSEYLAGLFVVALAILVRKGSERPDFFHWRLILYVVLLLCLWPLAFQNYSLTGMAVVAVCIGIAVVTFCIGWIFHRLGGHRAALCIALLGVMILTPFAAPQWNWDGKLIQAHRNYYGIYRIYYMTGALRLYNGTTLHGAQYVDPALSMEPLTYYHHKTLVGKVFDSGRFATGRIGIVGLGTGTLSAYGKAGETIDFFELDPDQATIATAFDYLSHSKAKLNFIYGDARLALRAVPSGSYDCLIIDAFSGDSIPVHLLTVEALQEYQRCLKYGGILLFHISNIYLELKPVLFSNARVVGASILTHTAEDERQLLKASKWVALTWKRETFENLLTLMTTVESNVPAPGGTTYKGGGWKPSPSGQSTAPAIPPPPHRGSGIPVRPWTDDYSHVLTVLNTDTFVQSLKALNPFGHTP